jgi:hypothetical protein
MPRHVYDIPQFGQQPIPAFGGYGPGSSAAGADAAFNATPGGRWANSLTGGGAGNRNPNAFYRGRIPPETAYQTRKKAHRIYPPAMAALVAQNALLGPTLDLARRGGMGYADLFGDIAPEYLRGYEEADPETSGLLSLLNMDATSLVNRGASDINEDTELQQLIRGGQASRGLTYSPGSSLEELINLDRARDTRRMARGRYAGEVQEAGRRYYSPALMALMLQYQNPVQATSTDDLLSLSLRDTAQRRGEQAARRAGQMALTGQIISSVLGAAGTAAGGAGRPAPGASGAGLNGGGGAIYGGSGLALRERGY